MTEEWKTLNDEQKTPYNEMSAREKERYEIEMRAFKEKIAREAAAGAPAAAGEKEEKIVGKKRPAKETPQKGKGKAEGAEKKGKESAKKKEKAQKPSKKDTAKDEEVKEPK